MKRTERIQTVEQAVPKLEFQAVVRHWPCYKWLLSHRQNQEQIDDRLIRQAEENKQRLGYILEKNIWEHKAGEGGEVCPLQPASEVSCGRQLAGPAKFDRPVLPRQSYQLHYPVP